LIKPAAERSGIHQNVGRHTLRHSYASLLIANGENVKVVQELMRHVSSRFTLDVYSQARMLAKHQAQQRLVEMVLGERCESPVPLMANTYSVLHNYPGMSNLWTNWSNLEQQRTALLSVS